MNYPIEAKAFPYYGEDEDEDFDSPMGYTLFTTIKVAPNVEVRSVIDRNLDDPENPPSPDSRVWFTELSWRPSPAARHGNCRHRIQPIFHNVTRIEAVRTAERLADLMKQLGRPTSRDPIDWEMYFRRVVRALEVSDLTPRVSSG